MRDYGKIFTSLWSSDTFRSMTEDGRALTLYLLSSPHGTIAGVFRLPDGYVCEDMQWDSERVSKGFAELFQKGFANRCETTKWVWVCKHLEWNPPENPNQRKSAQKIVDQVPSECGWKLDFMRASAELLGIEPPPKSEPLPNPSETLVEPVSVTGAVTVAGAEEKKPPAKRATPTPAIARPDDVAEQTWADWCQLRKAKSAPVTKTVLNGAVSEAGKAGMSLEDFLQVWCRRGSQGLEAAWLRPDERSTAKQPVNKQQALEQRNRAVADQWLRDQEQQDATH